MYRQRAASIESAVENGRGEARVRASGRQPTQLSPSERAAIIDHATSREFVDKAPQQMFYALLERGVYLGSPRTIYRVLAAQQLVGDRRPYTTHPPRAIPHLHATAPGQVASWDITAVNAARKSQYFYAYVMLDLFSRFMPAAQLHHAQSEHHAAPFIKACIAGFDGHVPTVIHSDNGSPMIAGSIIDLYKSLGITRSLSRPRVSNDNPYSEAAFKTVKYAPAYPDFFHSIDEAQEYFDDFREYYNNSHYHSGLNYYTPASVFNGTWPAIQAKRQQSLDAAYTQRPDRFHEPPRALPPPADVWINEVTSTITTTGDASHP